jgi:hypothetical protein
VAVVGEGQEAGVGQVAVGDGEVLQLVAAVGETNDPVVLDVPAALTIQY